MTRAIQTLLVRPIADGKSLAESRRCAGGSPISDRTDKYNSLCRVSSAQYTTEHGKVHQAFEIVL